MLKSHEELWTMDLPSNVNKLLASQNYSTGGVRENYKVVSYRAPYNTAV